MICYTAGNFEAGDSLYLAATAVVSAVLPSDVIEFAMLPAQRFLRKIKGGSFIIRFQVTSK